MYFNSLMYNYTKTILSLMQNFIKRHRNPAQILNFQCIKCY